jgi:hypothetical protein
MPKVYLEGAATWADYDPRNPFAEGGEATVHRLGKNQLLKIFRLPTDPYFANPVDTSAEQRNRDGAKVRLDLHQRKLRDFPRDVPRHLVAPTDLALERPNGRIVGYVMPFRPGRRLYDYCLRPWRDANPTDPNEVLAFMLDLYDTVFGPSGMHSIPMLIVDFNPFNVLVDGPSAFVIDADAADFGDYRCLTFTPDYVDPLICAKDQLVMNRPANKAADLYAFGILLWISQLYCHPYRGVHKPVKGSKDQPLRSLGKRVLARKTVFADDVGYPSDWAVHWSMFPDEILDWYRKLFHYDDRNGLPRNLLAGLRWTSCTKCGLSHARAVCPVCVGTAPARVVHTVVGDAVVSKVADLPANPLFITLQDGELRYLYWKDGEFHREFGSTGLRMPVNPEMRFALSGSTSFASLNERTVRLFPQTEPELLPAHVYRSGTPQFAANSRHWYWIHGDQLFRDDAGTPHYIGDILSGQTLLWVGPKFGVTCYQVGALQKISVFDAENRGIVGVDGIPSLGGVLVSATCYFSETRCWFLAVVRSGGRLVHRCFLIKPDGTCIATAEADAGDDSWLGHPIETGKTTAVLGSGKGTIEGLIAATDNGAQLIVRNDRTLAVMVEFNGTQGHVRPSDRLFYNNGLYVVRGSRVKLVRSRQ